MVTITHAQEQSFYLSTLSRSPAAEVKDFVDLLIPRLGEITVLSNRTGLVMVPMADTAQGTPFYVGEALIAEAHVRIGLHEGYAACLGRDLEQALAIALIDAAIIGRQELPEITAFIQQQAQVLEEADRQLAAQVEATRVEMETF